MKLGHLLDTKQMFLTKLTMSECVSPQFTYHFKYHGLQLHCIEKDKSPVTTLQRHLWTKVCFKFHENRGILKPISRNCDMGVFFTWNFVKSPKKGYILSFIVNGSWLFSMNLWLCNIPWCQKECFWNRSNRQINSLCIMNLWIFINMVKSHQFKHFSCFLKNRGLLKGFDFFSWFRKKGLFKELKISWFHHKKGYFFSKNFLKRGHILHATHMCTNFSSESPHRGQIPPPLSTMISSVPVLHHGQ